jgi:hypothetical protein
MTRAQAARTKSAAACRRTIVRLHAWFAYDQRAQAFANACPKASKSCFAPQRMTQEQFNAAH